MNRQTTKGWLLGIAVVLLSTITTVPVAFAGADHVRWDIIRAHTWAMQPRTQGFSKSKFYIAPNGNDSNPGTYKAPLKTWAVALAKLKPGYKLLVMPGIYTPDQNGPANVVGISGQSGKPITIRALVERQAMLEAGGPNFESMLVDGCSYLNIEGLEFHSNQQVTTQDFFGGLLHINDSHHVLVRRVAAQKTKQSGPFVNGHFTPFANHHGILIQGTQPGLTHHVLVEESEVYYYQRHGISATGVSYVVLRRNYTNPDPFAKLDIFGVIQPEGFVFYPAAHSIMENNISENTFEGITLKGVSGDGANISHNLLAGNISLNEHHAIGFVVAPEDVPPAVFPTNVRIENHLIAGPYCTGMLFSPGITNLQVVNLSLLAALDPICSLAYGPIGLISMSDFPDDPGPTQGNLADSVSFVNTLVLRFGDDAADRPAFNITNYSSVGIAYSISNGSSPNFPTASLTQTSEADPNVDAQGDPLANDLRVGLGDGDCMVNIPAGNPNLHGQGKNGADIGANITHRYVNGALTAHPLWNPETNEFPCGFDVIGAGNRCKNVHQRLHVGC